MRAITIKSAEEIEGVRRACRLAVKTLEMAGDLVKPGVSTETINQAVHEFTLDHGAIPAPLNYGGDRDRGVPPFPRSVCTSINDVICHGIPSKDEILREGDIVNIDVTPILNGFHGDTSRTYLVGEVSEEARRLVEVTLGCLMRGVAVVRPSARIREIGSAIASYAESFGFGVVREYVGHGIGREFHEEPQIPHYPGKENRRLMPGMIFTIEPMINAGSHETRLDPDDGWTVRTKDGSLSAQFEHTILVTEKGHEILTDWASVDHG